MIVEGMRMRVVVVDDNDVWRPSLVAALTSRGIDVVAECADGDELFDQLRRLDITPIDVAILDLRLPPTWSDEGIHLARELRRRNRELGVVILSGYEADVQLHYATQALGEQHGHGGIGYLFKDRINRGSLKEAVQRVAAGRVVVDPLFSQQVVEQYRGSAASAAEFTNREVDVLDLLVRGLTNREIAEKLHISIAVVERHLTKIFRQVVADPTGIIEGDARRENRRVLTVLEWLRRTGRLTD
jgi:DNA-binding NarL/FixJ family response regulator